SVVVSWRQCSGLKGRVKLRARITAPDCNALSGTFSARKSKINSSITAERSRCGDGVYDPLLPGEQCDATLGCPANAECTPGCTCKLKRGTGGTTTPTTTFPSLCGDRRHDPGEVCDPPGRRGGCPAGQVCAQGCAACTLCGNGTIDPGEACEE